MYLNEVEEILDRVQAAHLGPALVPLFKQVAKAINSPHFQVLSLIYIYISSIDITTSIWYMLYAICQVISMDEYYEYYIYIYMNGYDRYRSVRYIY